MQSIVFLKQNIKVPIQDIKTKVKYFFGLKKITLHYSTKNKAESIFLEECTYNCANYQSNCISLAKLSPPAPNITSHQNSSKK